MHIHRLVGVRIYEARHEDVALAQWSATQLGYPFRRQLHTLQELDGVGNTLQETLVARLLVEMYHLTNHRHRCTRIHGPGFIGTRMRRFQVFHRILVGPSSQRQRLLQVAQTAHRPQYRFLQFLHTQRGVALCQEFDVTRHHVVVDGDKRRVVGLSAERMVVHQRIALGPSAIVILTLQQEANGFLQGTVKLIILLLQIDAQQEFSTMHRGLVVEGRITVIMLELLQSPSLPTDGSIPFLRCLLRLVIEHIVPSTRRFLTMNDAAGHLAGTFVIIHIARGMIGIQQHLTHIGSTGRLQPYHRAPRLQLTPLTGKVGQIAPHETTFIRHYVHHVLRSTTHGQLSLLVARPRGESGQDDDENKGQSFHRILFLA